ncbi:MAG TPA: pyruvate kinase [Candidatus Saccharimonadales bacterium]|nr:pyruvate kinase [Candidatus Saccharimonadales bacterium]
MNTSSAPRVFKRAKILATVGPATDSYEKIEAMLKAGVNGFRLNFSHATEEQAIRWAGWVRQASEAAEKPVTILQDLQGPKIRLGDFEGKIELHKDQELRLVFKGEYDGANTLPIQYDLSKKVKAGERLYMYDGKVRTTVLGVEEDAAAVNVRVENDGFVLQRKGINLPDTDFGGDILTPKDLKDIDFGVTQDYDYVALSFVQSADDIKLLKKMLKEKGSEVKVIAKVETPAAIADENLEEIVKVSDGVMVARGDLAVEASPEVVPIVQRKILALCQKHGKISIVATQMLMSMVDSPEPTRAEVSDIATAVISGADCLMLSEESAMGSYPIEAIATMKRVILYTQEHEPVRPILYSDEPTRADRQDSISSAVTTLAHQIGAKAIICETKTGATARSIASHRPSMPIVSVTSVPRVAQQLTLLYANKSFLREDGENAGYDLAKELREQDFFDAGSTVVVVSGQQPGVPGNTDTIRVRVLE